MKAIIREKVQKRELFQRLFGEATKSSPTNQSTVVQPNLEALQETPPPNGGEMPPHSIDEDRTLPDTDVALIVQQENNVTAPAGESPPVAPRPLERPLRAISSSGESNLQSTLNTAGASTSEKDNSPIVPATAEKTMDESPLETLLPSIVLPSSVIPSTQHVASPTHSKLVKAVALSQEGNQQPRSTPTPITCPPLVIPTTPPGRQLTPISPRHQSYHSPRSRNSSPSLHPSPPLSPHQSPHTSPHFSPHVSPLSQHSDHHTPLHSPHHSLPPSPLLTPHLSPPFSPEVQKSSPSPLFEAIDTPVVTVSLSPKSSQRSDNKRVTFQQTKPHRPTTSHSLSTLALPPRPDGRSNKLPHEHTEKAKPEKQTTLGGSLMGAGSRLLTVIMRPYTASRKQRSESTKEKSDSKEKERTDKEKERTDKEKKEKERTDKVREKEKPSKSRRFRRRSEKGTEADKIVATPPSTSVGARVGSGKRASGGSMTLSSSVRDFQTIIVPASPSLAENMPEAVPNQTTDTLLETPIHQPKFGSPRRDGKAFKDDSADGKRNRTNKDGTKPRLRRDRSADESGRGRKSRGMSTSNLEEAQVVRGPEASPPPSPHSGDFESDDDSTRLQNGAASSESDGEVTPRPLKPLVVARRYISSKSMYVLSCFRRRVACACNELSGSASVWDRHRIR